MMPLHKVIWIKENGEVPNGFIVHHKNNDKLDNRLENLELMTKGDHARHHNQKYSIIKNCEICGIEFEPHPTKRKRQKTCSWDCSRVLSIRNNPTTKIGQQWLQQHGDF